ncbi:MAG: hypothetical protein JWQ18_35 [Conexibacter sp.]|nr:hypothetical protein [Conexibacter sp.]
MSRYARVVVLVVSLVSVFGVMSAAAGAVTWTNSGDTAFTATVVGGTLSSTGSSGSCPAGATATGTVASSPFVGNTWAGLTSTGTASNCTLAGVSTTLRCSYTLTAQSWVSGMPAVTTGTADINCDMTQFGTTICRLTGTGSGSYTNPLSPSTFGKATSGTGSLKVSNGTSGTCPMGNGDSVSVTHGTSTITGATGGPTPHLGPTITRTS